MDNLTFIPKHNVVAFLNADHPRATEDFREVFQFLQNSCIHFAISTDVLVYEALIREFWANVEYSVLDGIPTLLSIVQGYPVTVTEDVIRRVLQFNDAEGIECLPMEEVHAMCRQIGYERDFPCQMIKKTRVSFNWRYIAHTLIHCISHRQGGFDELNTVLGSGFVCLITQRQFNFSSYIFDCMKNHVMEKSKKFLLYPRFLQMILNSELEELVPEGELLSLQHMNWKIMGNMKKNFPATGFSGVFTPFFPHMLQINPPPVNDAFVDEPIEEPILNAPLDAEPDGEPENEPNANLVDEIQLDASLNPPHDISLEVQTDAHIDTILEDTEVAQTLSSLQFEQVGVSSSSHVYTRRRNFTEEISQLKTRVVSLHMLSTSQQMLIKSLQGELQKLRATSLANDSKIGGENEVNTRTEKEVEQNDGLVIEKEIEQVEQIEKENDDGLVIEKKIEHVEQIEKENDGVVIEVENVDVDKVESEKNVESKTVENEKIVCEESEKVSEKDVESDDQIDLMEDYPPTVNPYESAAWNVILISDDEEEEQNDKEEPSTAIEHDQEDFNDDDEQGMEDEVIRTEQVKDPVPKRNRVKQIAKKRTPSVVSHIKNKLTLWRKSMDAKRYREQLKSILVSKGNFHKRSVGQMKLDNLERNYIKLATKLKLNEMKKERDADEQVIKSFLKEKRKKEKEERKKKEMEDNDSDYVTLADLVRRQYTENPFQKERENDDKEKFVFDTEGQKHIEDVENWLDNFNPYEEGQSEVGEASGSGVQNVEVEGTGGGETAVEHVNEERIGDNESSIFRNPSSEELRAERIRLNDIRKGVPSKIIGWRFDVERSAIAVKRTENRCSYFYNFEDLVKLPVADLHQLVNLEMTNHGMFPHGTEVVGLLSKHSANNFKDLKRRFVKTKRRKLCLDRIPNITAKRQKVMKEKVIGWYMDHVAHEIVIERANGLCDRLYESADIRRLDLSDRLELYKLPFRNHEDYPDGPYFLKVLNFSVENLMN